MTYVNPSIPYQALQVSGGGDGLMRKFDLRGTDHRLVFSAREGGVRRIGIHLIGGHSYRTEYEPDIGSNDPEYGSQRMRLVVRSLEEYG